MTGAANTKERRASERGVGGDEEEVRLAVAADQAQVNVAGHLHMDGAGGREER